MPRRIETYDWPKLSTQLDGFGCAVLEKLLAPDECRQLAARYDEDALFRSRVVMARHGYGRGEYRYFDYPLPEPIAELRSALYPQFAAIANGWNARLGLERQFPAEHAAFLAQCHAGG